MSAPLTGILLAAGSARRFGGNKIVARLADGNIVGLAAAAVLAPAVDRLLVVVAPADTATAQVFDAAGYRTLCAVDAGLGMGHSLAAAVGACRDSMAWLVGLADMPFVGAPTVARLAALLREGAAIVAPRCGAVRGHPVGFNQRFAEELMALTGDTGARAILTRHAATVSFLDTDDAGVISDIDTPADLDRRDVRAGAPVVRGS